MMTADHIARLRLHVADVERDLRNAKDNYEAIKAASIEAAAPTGKNKEERDAQTTLFLAGHGPYRAALALYRDAEWKRDRALAELESAKDARREYEWSIRCRQADALAGRGVQSDHADPAGDVAFDDAMQHELDDALIYAANNHIEDYEF